MATVIPYTPTLDPLGMALGGAIGQGILSAQQQAEWNALLDNLQNYLRTMMPAELAGTPLGQAYREGMYNPMTIAGLPANVVRNLKDPEMRQLAFAAMMRSLVPQGGAGAALSVRSGARQPGVQAGAEQGAMMFGDVPANDFLALLAKTNQILNDAYETQTVTRVDPLTGQETTQETTRIKPGREKIAALVPQMIDALFKAAGIEVKTRQTGAGWTWQDAEQSKEFMENALLISSFMASASPHEKKMLTDILRKVGISPESAREIAEAIRRDHPDFQPQQTPAPQTRQPGKGSALTGQSEGGYWPQFPGYTIPRSTR